MHWKEHATVARIAVTAATVVWSAVSAAQAPPDPFAACREQLRRAPRDYESAYCFYRVTSEGRLWDEGARTFDDLMAQQPDNSWLVLAYGHVHRNRGP